MKSCTNLNEICPASSISGWLRYFAAAVSVCGGSVLAQEQVLLNYWSVLPQEEAAANANAPHAIRVIGEKGEAFEEVPLDPADIRNHPAIKEACVARLRSLHCEAQRLAEEYVSAGMISAVAYEKAWSKACKAFNVNALSGGGT